MVSKRIEELDIVKGMGMIIVILAHLIYRPEDSLCDYIFDAFATGFIVAYFMISAYVYNPGKRTIKDEYINKFKTLVIPSYVITGLCLIFGGIYCYFVHGYGFRQWIRNVSYTYLRPEISNKIFKEGMDAVKDYIYLDISASWFLWTMILSFIVFIPLAKVLYKKMGLSVACTIALFVIGTFAYVYTNQTPWNISHVPMYVSFMLMMQIVKEYDVLKKILNMNVWASIATLFVSIFIEGTVFYYIADTHMYEGQIGVFHVVKYHHWYEYHASQSPLLGMKDILIWTESLAFLIQGALCLISGLIIAKYIKKVMILNNGFRWIGKNTLVILITHCLLALPFIDLMHTYNRPGANWYLPSAFANVKLDSTIIVKSIISAVCAFACCIVICTLKDKIKKKLAK